MYSMTKYFCGKCHGEYGREEEALACEESHREVVKTRAERGRFFVDIYGYPKKIEATMDDGIVLHYELTETAEVVSEKKQEMMFFRSESEIKWDV